MEFHYTFALELGQYTPRDPKTLMCDSPEEAAAAAKAVYEGNPFGLPEPMKAKQIFITWYENDHFHGKRYDYDTLECIVN